MGLKYLTRAAWLAFWLALAHSLAHLTAATVVGGL